MNTITLFNTEYLRSSRTIESLLVTDQNNKNKVLYIYNYEGYSFRLFQSLLDLFLFFNNEKDSSIHFDSEIEIDNYLENLIF